MSSSVPEWQQALRALLAAHVEAVRTRWLARAPGRDDVDEILATDAVASAVETALHDATAPALVTARASLAGDARWARLATALDLDALDLQWLALLALCELDTRVTRALGYLDDGAPTDPTPALGAMVWEWPPGYQPGPAGRIAGWRLAGPRMPEWRSATPWALDPEVAAFVAGDERWADYHGAAIALDVDGLDCLHPRLAADMARAAASLPGGVEIELVGPTGSGRRTVLAQVAAMLGRPAVLVDGADPVRALRAARLSEALPVFVDSDPGDAVGAVSPGIALVAREVPASTPIGHTRLSWGLPELTSEQRVRLWDRHALQPTAGDGADGMADMPRAIAEWGVTAGDVLAGAAAAPAGEADAVVRRRLRGGPLMSLRALPCPYSWEDLIVPRRIADELARLRTQVERSREVLDTWEMRRLAPLAVGTTALFAGPSGTGKTMAAQVLAGALGLDLYQVDLAEVVNKYVGETEKRLAALFDQCERSHVMVLFDEADALFGHRTKANDAHDRYANIEIDYLLQRLDSFRGVAVLATNRKGDLDPAFLRRIRVMIDFVSPGIAERERLWRLALPEQTSTGVPVASGIDHEWFARHIELTGAEIKSVVLAAAFDARADHTLISPSHVIEASRRELAKKGAVLRVDPVPPTALVVAS